MLLIKAVAAYMAVLQMMEREMDYESAHALVVLKGRLQEHAEFFQDEERKLAERYGQRNGDGQVTADERGHFALRPGTAEEYMRRRTELGSVDIQAEWEPVRVKRPGTVRPAQLEALDGLVEFV